MMNRTEDIPDVFIVTVASEVGDFEADLEIPSGLPLAEMEEKLVGILKILDEEKFKDWRGCRLRYRGRVLQEAETLADAGAFDGSRLVVSGK